MGLRSWVWTHETAYCAVGYVYGVENPDIGRAREAMTKVVAAGHQASDVITNVRGLFGKDTQERTPTDLNTLIQSVLAVVSIDLRKHGIESQVTLSEQLPPVIGNEVQLQ